MIKFRLFVISALMMLFTVVTAMAQAPAVQSCGLPPGLRGSSRRWVRSLLALPHWAERSATVAQLLRPVKALRAIRAPAAAYSRCCCLAWR